MFFNEFHNLGIIKVGDLFEKDGKPVEFPKLKQQGTPDSLHLEWVQLIDSRPKQWRDRIKEEITNSKEIASEYSIYFSISVILSSEVSYKIMYVILLNEIGSRPTSIQYWEEKLNSDKDEIGREYIFLLSKNATIVSYTRCFQYKIVNSALFLNGELFKMSFIASPVCMEETQIHLFGQCSLTLELWRKLQNWLRPSLVLPELTLKNALLGQTFNCTKSRAVGNLINHILLILKRSLYEMRSRQVTPSVSYIVNRIRQIMYKEYQIAKNSDKLALHFKKWDIAQDIVGSQRVTGDRCEVYGCL